jgi:serine protease AprX
MLKTCIKAIFLLLPFVFAQALGQVKYYVQFSDKNNSPYSVNQPAAFLTKRSIDRRAHQHIAVVADDLPVNKQYIQAVLNIGVSIQSQTRWLNGVVISTTDSTKIPKVRSLPFVVSVKRVQGTAFRKAEQSSKFDREMGLSFFKTALEAASAQVNIAYNYGGSLGQVKMMGGDSLHVHGYTGQGMVMAVLDAGFNSVNTLPAFDSLRKGKQLLGTWDFVSRDSMVFDDDKHGMMVLSCIAGNIPGKLIGTAPKAEFWLLRTEEAIPEYLGEEYYWAAGAEFADSVGADIISSSLGYNTFDDASQNHSYADMNGRTTPAAIAANKAARKGILVLVSAGNEGNTAWKRILTPADADSVIAVAAVDINKVRTYFSSIGPSSDGRIKPTVAAQGSNVVVASLGGGVEMQSGTSFACPLLAGLAACVWQQQPGLTNMDLYSNIKRSADRHLQPDSLTGYGIPDFYKIFTGIAEIGYAPAFSIYPNPFKDAVHLKYYNTSGEPLHLELMDIKGQLAAQAVFASNAWQNEFELSGLEHVNNGFYFLKLTSGNASHVYKLIKY